MLNSTNAESGEEPDEVESESEKQPNEVQGAERGIPAVNNRIKSLEDSRMKLRDRVFTLEKGWGQVFKPAQQVSIGKNSSEEHSEEYIGYDDMCKLLKFLFNDGHPLEKVDKAVMKNAILRTSRNIGNVFIIWLFMIFLSVIYLVFSVVMNSELPILNFITPKFTGYDVLIPQLIWYTFLGVVPSIILLVCQNLSRSLFIIVSIFSYFAVAYVCYEASIWGSAAVSLLAQENRAVYTPLATLFGTIVIGTAFLFFCATILLRHLSILKH